MIMPVRCILEEIEPRKTIIKRMIGRAALWTFLMLYILGLHFVLAGYVAWLLTDMKEVAQRERLIKQGAYVVQSNYSKGFIYKRGR